jgi:phosphoglycerate dehydrogenase-like enzyme
MTEFIAYIRRALASSRRRETNERRATNMELGIFGLGRMGGNMATRLAHGGHRVVASNRSPGPVDQAKAW